jgi:hypothetical protein
MSALRCQNAMLVGLVFWDWRLLAVAFFVVDDLMCAKINVFFRQFLTLNNDSYQKQIFLWVI